jgi:hypothetical protein
VRCRGGVGGFLLCVAGCSVASLPSGDALETLGDPTTTATTGMSNASNTEGEIPIDESSGGSSAGDPQCADGDQNGDETDVDCGGGCGPCGPGQGCAAPEDCTTQMCVDDVCAGDAACTNGTLDGDETDVDCGGSCQLCDLGDSCVDADDCASGLCVDLICTPPNCGDGMVQNDEECDEGMETPTCTAFCTMPVCGDSFVQRGEACDDGGESSACDADCTAASCGDGVVNATAGEACEGGESSTCDADCTSVSCGDGTFNASAGEGCDTGGASASCDADCTAASCGDGTTNGAAGEACDDAGQTAACDGDCSAVSCGDGYLNPAAGEECEAGDPFCEGCLSVGCGADPQSLAISACMATYVNCEVVDGGVVGWNDPYCTGCNCGPSGDPWRFYCTVTSASNYNCSACTVGEILAAHEPCNCDPGTSPVVGSFCG